MRIRFLLVCIRFLLVRSQDIVLNECFSALDSAWQTLHILAVINDNRSGSVNDKILTQWVSSDCRSILTFEYIEEKYSYFTTIFIKGKGAFFENRRILQNLKTTDLV